MTPVIALERVSRRFGTTEVLRDLSLALEPGSVTCLLGDNGAGKSTAIRMLSGVLEPSDGRLLVDGEPARFQSPRDALARGIATVHQDLALVPLMPVWRNFVLGNEPTRGRGLLRRLDVHAARRVTRDALGELGIAARDVELPLGMLSGGERQVVAIARAIHFGARALILDEPTAALGVRQAALVLRFVAGARERGIAILLVTHNPQHALGTGDRFVVLRQGEVVGRFERGGVTGEQLMRLMEGETTAA